MASILTPHYYAKRMTDQALIRFFTEVADGSPIPVLMYCAPAYAAGVILSASAVSVLTAHPNIVGMKDTSKEDIADYVKAVPAGAEFHVLAGTITKFFYGLQSGAIGGVLSMANYFPELCCQLQDLFAQADVMSLHCPNIPETRGMVNRELLFAMKPNAYFINCARGEVVDFFEGRRPRHVFGG